MPLKKAGSDDVDWSAISARALAALALQGQGNLKDADMSDRASFLKGLGLPRSDIALILGSTEESIRKTLERAGKVKKRGTKTR